MSARTRLRRLRMGAETLLGLRAQGFFLPYRYAHRVEPPGSYPALEALLRAAEPAISAVLDRIEAGRATLAGFAGPAPLPRWDQQWFPRLDGAAAWTLAQGAARIVEVGSGHSTRFLARAIADEALETELVCIDPAPRAPLRGLPVRWIEDVVQRAADTCFARLQPGDILFVDSSHVLMPGTDVDWLLNRILPGLAAGVLVHFHDVFLPDPYPGTWSWRGYNEQQALAALLAGRA